MSRLLRPGWIFFAVSIIAFGAQNLLWASHGEPVLPIIPWLPEIPLLAYLTGLAFLAAGVCLALNLRTRSVAVLLGILLLVFEVFFEIPRAVSKPMDLSLRTVVFEVFTLCGSAFMLAGVLPSENRSSPRWNNASTGLIQAGRYLFAASSIVFGISHFLVPQFIATLIPGWVPGSGLLWAYLTGIAFVAAGLSFATNCISRWAATMLGVMFLLWCLVLHLPRVLSYPRSHDPAEWSSAFIALGICGGSWIAANAFSPETPHTLNGD
jgi:uncharacterized membrane protein